jgi:hypothetical protein
MPRQRRPASNNETASTGIKFGIVATFGARAAYQFNAGTRPGAATRGERHDVVQCKRQHASNGSPRNDLARLLGGFLSEQAIMVVAPFSTGETRREEALQQEPMHLFDRVRLFGSALLRRNVHVHGLATEGAMTLDRRRSYRAVGALAGWH